MAALVSAACAANGTKSTTETPEPASKQTEENALDRDAFVDELAARSCAYNDNCCGESQLVVPEPNTDGHRR